MLMDSSRLWRRKANGDDESPGSLVRVAKGKGNGPRYWRCWTEGETANCRKTNCFELSDALVGEIKISLVSWGSEGAHC